MAMAGDLLRLSLSTQPKLSFSNGAKIKVNRFDLLKRRCHRRFSYRTRSTLGAGFFLFNSLETRLQPEEQKQKASSSILLDVSGMMCGGCVSRVKSVVVNLLTETAAIKLKQEEIEGSAVESVAESIAQRVNECGFEAKRRVSGLGIGENVKKWKEMSKKKDELLIKSRNRVAFAWTLVTL